MCISAQKSHACKPYPFGVDGINFQKKYVLLEIKLNVTICTENLFFILLHRVGAGGGVKILKNFF